MSQKTFIDPDPTKEKVMIDSNGNEVIPFTKQIVKPVEQEPQAPTAPEPAPSNLGNKINELVNAKVKEKIDEIVAKRVEEALKDL